VFREPEREGGKRQIKTTSQSQAPFFFHFHFASWSSGYKNSFSSFVVILKLLGEKALFTIMADSTAFFHGL